MFQALDGPAESIRKTISSSEVLAVNSSALEDRQMVSIQPLDGDVYLSYISPASQSNAFMKVFKGQYAELERSSSLPIYIVADTGSVVTLIGEIA